MRKMISVIIPINKESKYIEQTIMSCLEQTYNAVELWVLDGGQSKKVSEQVAIYAKRYPCIHVMNYGGDKNLIDAYNETLKQIEGEYVGILSADDVALGKRFEKQVNILEQDSKVSLVCSDMQGIDARGEACYPSFYKHYKINVYNEDQTAHLIQANFVSASTILFRKQLLTNLCPIPNTLPYEDWWMGVVASLQGKVHFIEEALVNYRELEAYTTEVPSKREKVKERVDIAMSNTLYYKAFCEYFRANKYHYLAVVQPMELRDTLMSTYSLKQRLAYYYSERTYMCRRKIRSREKLKIQGYLWFGPYLMMMRR